MLVNHSSTLDHDLQPSRLPICIEFDGVIHQWSGQWDGDLVIQGVPCVGMMERLFYLIQLVPIRIHSCRSRSLLARVLMRRWLRRHAGALWKTSPGSSLRGLEEIQFPKHKPHAALYIDSRSWRVSAGPGSWPSSDMIMDLATKLPSHLSSVVI